MGCPNRVSQLSFPVKENSNPMKYVSIESDLLALGLNARAAANSERMSARISFSSPPWKIFSTQLPPGARQVRQMARTCRPMSAERTVSSVLVPVVEGAASETTASKGPASDDLGEYLLREEVSLEKPVVLPRQELFIRNVQVDAR